MEKPDKTAMPRKIQVTLPDRIANDLEKWADYEGRPLANLCNYLLEVAVKAEKASSPDWAKQSNPSEDDKEK